MAPVIIGLAVTLVVEGIILSVLRRVIAEILGIRETLATTTPAVTIESDPFIEDAMNYAFECGLSPTLMPDNEGNNTLFDCVENRMFEVGKMFTTKNKKGSPEYNEVFGKMRDMIDLYVTKRIERQKEGNNNEVS